MRQLWRNIVAMANAHKGLAWAIVVAVFTTVGYTADIISLVQAWLDRHGNPAEVVNTPSPLSMCIVYSGDGDKIAMPQGKCDLEASETISKRPGHRQRIVSNDDGSQYYGVQVIALHDKQKTIEYLATIGDRLNVAASYKRDVVAAVVKGEVWYRAIFFVGKKNEAVELCNDIKTYDQTCHILALTIVETDSVTRPAAMQ